MIWERTVTLGLALILAAGLAGCIGLDDSGEEASPQSAPSAATPSAGNASEESPQTRSFQADGYFGTGALVEVGLPTGDRPGVFAVPDGSDTLAETGLSRPLTTFNATVTWSPTSPATEQLHAWIGAIASCGSNCYRLVHGTATVGTSPLELRLDDTDVSEDFEEWAIAVHPADQTPTEQTQLWLAHDQGWQVEATAVLASSG